MLRVAGQGDSWLLLGAALPLRSLVEGTLRAERRPGGGRLGEARPPPPCQWHSLRPLPSSVRWHRQCPAPSKVGLLNGGTRKAPLPGAGLRGYTSLEAGVGALPPPPHTASGPRGLYRWTGSKPGKLGRWAALGGPALCQHPGGKSSPCPWDRPGDLGQAGPSQHYSGALSLGP